MAKIGVIHYNLKDFDWVQFLDYCVRTGFEYIEVAIGDVWGEGVDDPEAQAKVARQQLDDRGLKASALSAGNDFVLLDDDAIAAQIERMRRICCDIAPILGTDTIRTEGGWAKDAVPPEIIEAGQMAGASRWQLMTRVRLPAARTEIKTSPGPGTGSGRSTMTRADSAMVTTRMACF